MENYGRPLKKVNPLTGLRLKNKYEDCVYMENAAVAAAKFIRRV